MVSLKPHSTVIPETLHPLAILLNSIFSLKRITAKRKGLAVFDQHCPLTPCNSHMFSSSVGSAGLLSTSAGVVKCVCVGFSELDEAPINIAVEPITEWPSDSTLLSLPIGVPGNDGSMCSLGFSSSSASVAPLITGCTEMVLRSHQRW